MAILSSKNPKRSTTLHQVVQMFLLTAGAVFNIIFSEGVSPETGSLPNQDINTDETSSLPEWMHSLVQDEDNNHDVPIALELEQMLYSLHDRFKKSPTGNLPLVPKYTHVNDIRIIEQNTDVAQPEQVFEESVISRFDSIVDHVAQVDPRDDKTLIATKFSVVTGVSTAQKIDYYYVVGTVKTMRRCNEADVEMPTGEPASSTSTSESSGTCSRSYLIWSESKFKEVAVELEASRPCDRVEILETALGDSSDHEQEGGASNDGVWVWRRKTAGTSSSGSRSTFASDIPSTTVSGGTPPATPKVFASSRPARDTAPEEQEAVLPTTNEVPSGGTYWALFGPEASGATREASGGTPWWRRQYNAFRGSRSNNEQLMYQEQSDHSEEDQQGVSIFSAGGADTISPTAHPNNFVGRMVDTVVHTMPHVPHPARYHHQTFEDQDGGGQSSAEPHESRSRITSRLAEEPPAEESVFYGSPWILPPGAQVSLVSTAKTLEFEKKEHAGQQFDTTTQKYTCELLFVFGRNWYHGDHQAGHDEDHSSEDSSSGTSDARASTSSTEQQANSSAEQNGARPKGKPRSKSAADRGGLEDDLAVYLWACTPHEVNQHDPARPTGHPQTVQRSGASKLFLIGTPSAHHIEADSCTDVIDCNEIFEFDEVTKNSAGFCQIKKKEALFSKHIWDNHGPPRSMPATSHQAHSEPDLNHSDGPHEHIPQQQKRKTSRTQRISHFAKQHLQAAARSAKALADTPSQLIKKARHVFEDETASLLSILLERNLWSRSRSSLRVVLEALLRQRNQPEDTTKQGPSYKYDDKILLHGTGRGGVDVEILGVHLALHAQGNESKGRPWWTCPWQLRRGEGFWFSDIKVLSFGASKWIKNTSSRNEIFAPLMFNKNKKHFSFHIGHIVHFDESRKIYDTISHHPRNFVWTFRGVSLSSDVSQSNQGSQSNQERDQCQEQWSDSMVVPLVLSKRHVFGKQAKQYHLTVFGKQEAQKFHGTFS